MTDTRTNDIRFFGDAVWIAGAADGVRLHPHSAVVYRMANTDAGTMVLTDARHLRVGSRLVVVNEHGTNALGVNTDGGDAVDTIAAGNALCLWLADNSTAGGIWVHTEVTPL